MKYLFSIVLITAVSTSFSQNTQLEYDVLSSGETTKIQLTFNDSVAIGRLLEDSNSNEETLHFFKNQNEGLAYFSEQFFNIKFYVKDSLHKMIWQLTDDTITILNEKCNAARTNFRGRDYIAFYAPSIASNNGPWKFGGLPGLILSVKSKDNFIEWKASKITRNYTGKIVCPNIKKYKFLSWREFVDKYKKAVNYYIKAARSSGNISDDSEFAMKLEDVEIFYPELQTGQGIKF